MRILSPHCAAPLLALALLLPAVAAANPKALFDLTHAEIAGNADWQIDTDQPLPLPDQSTVTEATPRTYWLGAISSWGIDLVKRGYSVATLTTAYGITYGNAGNPYDLSKYDVFIVPEPNTSFTAAEATAIFNFVRDGGGLVAVSDHNGSDRNNDGVDSPHAWNAFDPSHLLGVSFDVSGNNATDNFVQNSGNVETSLSDSIIHGPNGVADSVSYHNGTSLILYPAVNPSVKADIWMNGVSHSSTTQVMAAHSVYGNGRIFFVGDSSPIDDGSATNGNSSIFDGWGEAGGRDSLLFQNATMWVTRRAGDTQAPTVTVSAPDGSEDWKAGSSHAITWSASDNVSVTAVDLAWSSDGGATYPIAIATGIANNGSYTWSVPNAPTTTARVRVTAHDAAGNSGLDASNANFTIDTWTITAMAGAHGSIAPSGAVAVAQGASKSFTITPDAGYAIASLTVDGSGVPVAGSYTFSNVTADHTIAATFADSQPPTMTVTSPNGGETWGIGVTHDITWSASDNVGVDSIDIEVSDHGADGPWQPVALGLANAGSYSWVVSGPTSDSAMVRVTARDASGLTASDVSDSLFRIVIVDTAVPGPESWRFALAPPAPNPSGSRVGLKFTLPAAAWTRLEIVDLAGRVVRTLADARFEPGTHSVAWNGHGTNGRRLTPGVYFVRLTSGGRSSVMRLVRM